jgi:hypothetical protein
VVPATAFAGDFAVIVIDCECSPSVDVFVDFEERELICAVEPTQGIGARLKFVKFARNISDTLPDEWR